MPSINCNVNNCAHNTSGICHSNKISVNGKKARTSNNTCCSSFINETNYNNFSNSTLDDTPCNYLSCNVRTCSNNASGICALQNVSITPNIDNPNLSAETYCSSFRCK